MAQQQQQLVQCNGQLLGREHAQGQEDGTMLHDDVDDSIDDIENDDDSNIYQQHDHRLNAAHFRAAVLDEEDGSEGANKRPQKAEIHRFWTRKNSYDNGLSIARATSPELHIPIAACMYCGCHFL